MNMRNNKKLQSVIHYVCGQYNELCEKKIMRILWLADCECFRKTGQTITGKDNYIKHRNMVFLGTVFPCLIYLKKEGYIKNYIIQKPFSENYELSKIEKSILKNIDIETSEDFLDMFNTWERMSAVLTANSKTK